jgi:hypothetical protein
MPSCSGWKNTARSLTDFWCRAVIVSGCTRSRSNRARYFSFEAVREPADRNTAASNAAFAPPGTDQDSLTSTLTCW